MTINITPNDYKEVTECREVAVQGICDAFLSDNCWHILHPCSDGAYRYMTRYIVKHADGKYHGFSQKDNYNRDRTMEIHRCEVELAIDLLLKAGYHLYRTLEYGTWVGYIISKNPRLTDGYRKVNCISDCDWSGYFK